MPTPITTTTSPSSSSDLSTILYDGFAVYQALTPQARLRTSPENVSDVLDAVVRAIRTQRTVAGALVRHEMALHDLIETRREAQEKPCG